MARPLPLVLVLAALAVAAEAQASPGDLWDLYMQSKKGIEEGRPLGTEPSLYGPIALDPVDRSWERAAREAARRRTRAARLARAKSAPELLVDSRSTRMTSDFGMRSDPVHGGPDTHAGIDIAAPRGSAILAAQDGIVRFAGAAGGYGFMVELEHEDGTRTRYAHASKVLVREGEAVLRGEAIATVGATGRATGTHLHFEVRRGGVPVDPVPMLAKYARDAARSEAARRQKVAAADEPR